MTHPGAERACAILFIVLAAAVAAGKCLAQEERTVFVQGDRRYDVVVPLDQVGILLSEKAAAAGGADALGLGAWDLRPTGEGAGRLIIARFTASKTRKEIVELARELRSMPGDMVTAAGLVVRYPVNDSFVVATDTFIVQFHKHVSRDAIESMHKRYRVSLVADDPYVPNLQLLTITKETPGDVLAISNLYNGSALVKFAHPNFIRMPDARQSGPDTFLYRQWHLENTGLNGGTIDADIDALRAWQLEQGDPNVVIAILDGSGFDLDHPDLAANRWTNPTENGGDEDGNGYINDFGGWNFAPCGSTAPAGCGNNDPDWSFASSWGPVHGTLSAGAAVAVMDNARGVAGVCPRCRYIPIRLGNFDYADHLAIRYAMSVGADIMSNSWGCEFPCRAVTEQAIDDAAQVAGMTVFFAMPNEHVDHCASVAEPDYSSRDTVIGVSAVDNQDRILTGTGDHVGSGFDYGAAFGDCMDVLSPTWGGTLWAATTDLAGSSGYNTDQILPVCPEAPDPDYTFCATGTSFATPVAAGVAGLLLSARPGLNRRQIQNLLQDTADKVQDSVGSYGVVDGFSSPSSGVATHGYGRINAYEAVHVVASPDVGGLGGVDVFIRDNRLDWGNTEQPSNTLFETPRGFIPHWQSVDIKVDAPPLTPNPPATAAAFDAFVHEDPIANAANKVYVRLRNRGPVAATDVFVKLHWAFAGAGLPALPGDFWTRFPDDSIDTTQWKPLGVVQVGSLPYSGASAAGKPGDSAAIAAFTFDAPALDPALPNAWHYCLFAVMGSAQDPVAASSQSMFIPDQITPTDNNVTHRNVVLRDSPGPGMGSLNFFVNNPFTEPVTTFIRFDGPEDWELAPSGFVLEEPFAMTPQSKKPLALKYRVPSESADRSAHIYQMLVGEGGPTVLGGITIQPK